MELFIYGTAEPAAAIMAASIPALRALVQQESKKEPARFVELSDKHLASPVLSFKIRNTAAESLSR